MSDLYRELLDAAYFHLLDLKQQGNRYVVASPDMVKALTSDPAATPPASALAPEAPKAAPAPRVSAPPARAAVPISRAPASAPAAAAPAALAPFSSEPLQGEAKLNAMLDLAGRAAICQKCPHLVRSRKNVVFGVGDINSPLMFVGEAPGADEDQQGEPFVGKAGQLLTKIIQTMSLSRETVYIANILKCRPDIPGQTAGNRKPTPEEVNTCLPYLMAQIDLVRPKVIVTLGGTAMEGLFGQPALITKMRGTWHEFRGIPVMPTYHPSYLLRNQALSVKREVWEDMLKVMERLEMPISEKQQRYFLPA
ncbi:MAG TPA: uracil-DNA glycosylase [Methylomirabilota bacterium]|nr:uracil-DNA glycosylase [Methylomirabilota bacterium]